MAWLESYDGEYYVNLFEVVAFELQHLPNEDLYWRALLPDRDYVDVSPIFSSKDGYRAEAEAHRWLRAALAETDQTVSSDVVDTDLVTIRNEISKLKARLDALQGDGK